MHFRFTVKHPEAGEYLTGDIGAESRDEAKRQVQKMAEEQFQAYRDRDDRVAVDPADATISLKEVKN